MNWNTHLFYGTTFVTLTNLAKKGMFEMLNYNQVN
jgi:hypothetical protein